MLYLEQALQGHRRAMVKAMSENAAPADPLPLESLQRELSVGRQRCREQLAAIGSEMKLELHCERGRQRDALMSLGLKVQDLENRAAVEGSNGLAHLGKLRHEIIYTLYGLFFHLCCGTAGLSPLLQLIKQDFPWVTRVDCKWKGECPRPQGPRSSCPD